MTAECTRIKLRQRKMRVPREKLLRNSGHPFEGLNRVMKITGFDAFVESLCARFYAERGGRPSLRLGRYFRMLLVGYFEGIDAERGIAWRVADYMRLRAFLEYEPEETVADHSTLSWTQRRFDVKTHRAVVTWVLERLAEAKVLRGRTIGIDVTKLEANAAIRVGSEWFRSNVTELREIVAFINGHEIEVDFAEHK